MERQLPVLKPHITELNLTLLKILSEIQSIKIQQREIIEIITPQPKASIEEYKQPTNDEVSKGWFF
tara:strand:- start:40 stop:237 length:198 start_codon:yes stop_codon:yes gene_type:complete